MATIDTSEEVRGSAPSNPPRENLVRAVHGITLERSDASDASLGVLRGHFAVWDTWTEIRSSMEGNFLERFAPGSMTKTLSESTPKVLFGHGRDNVIGDKPLGTIVRLEPDGDGAYYEVDLFDTSYNRDLLPGLDAGVYGASHRFSVVREDVVQRPKKSEYNPRGITERTVLEARVMEFGPCTWPAYPSATAGMRSMTDEYILATLAHDKELSRRSGISLAGVRTPFEQRVDASDIGCLTSMLNLGACYLTDQDETDDASDIAAMTGVLKTLAGLIDGEITEPTEPDMPTTGMYSAAPEGDEREDLQDEEPDASERTTPTAEPGTEPEPPEATTHSDRDLFWFADTPTHLKRSK